MDPSLFPKPALMRQSRSLVTLFTAAVLLLVSGCRTSGPDERLHPQAPEAPLILISLDGFMPDYLERFDTPHLDEIAREGVRAESLIPVFPTKTFPNHFSIVTGLYPSNHGIISNTMYDPVIDEWFSLGRQEAVSDAHWWEGEPIWVTAEKQGVTAATFFWPGSEAAIQGVRPSFWKPYDHDFPNEQRVDTVLAWLDLPQDQRPSIVTLYFADVDSEGHRYGPFSDETARAVAHVDSMIGLLVEGLEARGIYDDVNLMIVSDHGMSETSAERVIILDDYIDPDHLRIIDRSPLMMAEPVDIDVHEAIALLDAAPNLRAYHRDDVPERWHFRDHYRIPSIIAIADDGYTIATQEYYDRARDRIGGGAHGYDIDLPSMHGIFLAHGPAFRKGETVGPFSSVHLYNIMTLLLGLEPSTNDGSVDSLFHLLDDQYAPLLVN